MKEWTDEWIDGWVDVNLVRNIDTESGEQHDQIVLQDSFLKMQKLPHFLLFLFS